MGKRKERKSRRTPLAVWLTDDELKILRREALDGFHPDDVLGFSDSQREDICEDFIRDLVFEALDPYVDHLNLCLEQFVESEGRHSSVSDLLDNSENETFINHISTDYFEDYGNFYNAKGPGVIVLKRIDNVKDWIFYRSVDELINLLKEFSDQESVSSVFQGAIRRAEQIDPNKESLFIVEVDGELALIHYRHDERLEILLSREVLNK